ncbi:MAG: helix-turn-helix domain-containing protein [Clostridium sp.]
MARPVVFNTQTRNQMVIAYKGGASMRQIAKHFGASVATVHAVLKEANANTRPTFDFNTL